MGSQCCGPAVGGSVCNKDSVWGCRQVGVASLAMQGFEVKTYIVLRRGGEVQAFHGKVFGKLVFHQGFFFMGCGMGEDFDK